MAVHPFRLGEAIIQRAQKTVRFKVLRKKHLLETAIDWQAKKRFSERLLRQWRPFAESEQLSPIQRAKKVN